MSKILSYTLLFFFVLNCSVKDASKEENYIPQGTLMRINSYTVTCQAFIVVQCLLVQQDDQIGTDKWESFSQTIEGFDYEEGYRYDLDVKITKIENPPADASSLRYELIKLIGKFKP